MRAPHHLRLRSDVAEVGRTAEYVNALLLDVLDEEGRFAVELALVEALNNVVLHGYRGDDGFIDVYVGLSQDEVAIEVVDTGRPIPSEALARAGDTGLDAADDPLDSAESGRGLALIMMNMDSVSYRADEGGNRLTLTRRIHPSG